MPRKYRDPDLSLNCRTQHGMPHRPAQARCTGCSCGCHAVAPPADFRARVQVARDARREQDAPGTRGEARPGADGGRG